MDADDEARRLLGFLGVTAGLPAVGVDRCGRQGPNRAPDPNADPVADPVVAVRAERGKGAAIALEFLAGRLGAELIVDMPALIDARHAETGWRPGGLVSANGTARLLRTQDGWLAVNLARAEDRHSVPAVISRPTLDPWADLAAYARGSTGADAVDRLRLCEIPAAVLGEVDVDPNGPWRLESLGAPGAKRRSAQGLRVVNLSAMWAGPLCARLFSRVGAEVVDVEATGRPDGARSGPPRFYESLHAGHTGRELDFATAAGRTELRELIATADVVIESSRPRALNQLGVHLEQVFAARAGLTWISITGYGRDVEAGRRVAFGDDAAVAGGLVEFDTAGAPRFVGDAIADPLTGIYAAVAGLASVAWGGGHLVDVAMARVSADVARPGRVEAGQ